MTDKPVDKNHRGFSVIRVSGSDRTEFLQGQLTHDVSRAAGTQALLAGWCNPKGRLITLLWVAGLADAYLLVCPTALAETVERRLRMFVLRSDVTIEPLVSAVQGMTETSHNFDKDNLSYCFNDNNLYLREALALSIGDAEPGALDNVWRLNAIRQGIPTVWGETTESFVPQMLNLDLLDGISFSKGCYVGQEIVARTQNLGRIKRRMYRFCSAEPAAPLPGASINANGKPAGEVVDAVATSAGSEMLAVCRIESLGAELTIDVDGPVPLERLSLPYAVPESI